MNTSPVADRFRPSESVTRPIETRAPKGFARADINLSSSNVLTVRGNYQRTTANDTQRESLSALERGRSLHNRIGVAGMLDTQVLGSSAVNEARLQWGRSHFDTDVDGFCPGCAALNYPDIKLGKPANAPQSFLGDRVELADVLTWLAPGQRARQTLKAGLDANIVRQSGLNPGNTSATHVFGSDTPFDPSIRDSYPKRFTHLSARCAYARAKFGSMSTARRKKGMAAAPPEVRFSFWPVL